MTEAASRESPSAGSGNAKSKVFGKVADGFRHGASLRLKESVKQRNGLLDKRLKDECHSARVYSEQVIHRPIHATSDLYKRFTREPR